MDLKAINNVNTCILRNLNCVLFTHRPFVLLSILMYLFLLILLKGHLSTTSIKLSKTQRSFLKCPLMQSGRVTHTG